MSSETPVYPDDAFCDHYEKLEKRRFNRLFSRVAAIRATEDGAEQAGYPDIFDYTHHPITVFKQATDDDTAGPKPVREDEILDEFDPTRLKNFSVVIEGPVGTGKSELCAYLTNKLRNEHGRPVLRVDKDSDLLTMLTETIPEFYERELGETLDTSGDLRALAEGLKSNPEVVAGLVVTKGLRLLGQEYDIDVSPEKKAGLEDFILGRLNELVERRHQGVDNVEDDREGFRFITQQDYESGHHEELYVFPDSNLDREPYELLNDKFWSALLKEFDSPPLNDLLMEVGQAFDTRPVCVFEDFSIAAVQAEKLRNYMERDNDEDNWDFIIAGTTDYTRALRTQTSQDRFRFYQTNKPESKQVDFLDEDSVVDFIRPYLAYPKTSDESLVYNGDGELQAPPDRTICGTCTLCSNDFRDLFPFNKTFIERIYNPGLDEEDRRPRSIIIIVKDILEEVYYGPTEVPSDAQVLDEEVNSPDVLVSDNVLSESDTIANLARWYGKEVTNNGNTYYAVARAFATAFDVKGIPKPQEEAEGTTVANVKFDTETIYIPAAGDTGDDIVVGPEDGEDDDTGGDDQPTPSSDPVERKYKELRREVADWKNDPTSDEYAETRKYMEAGIKELLDYLTDDFTFWNGTDLGFYIGKKRPFVYKNSSEAPEPHQSVLDLDRFRSTTHRSLLKFGIRREEGSSPSAEQFLEEEGHGTHFTRLADQWRSKLISQYITSDEILYKKAAQNRNYEFDDFIVATYAWLVMLDDPWKEITAETLNERYQDPDDLSIDTHLEDALSVLPDDSERCFSAAMKTAPYIEDLLGARLGVTQDILDVPTLRNHLRRHSPYDVIDNLAKNPYIDNIDRRIRFNTKDESKFQEMALRMYKLQRAIGDNVVDMPRSVDEEAIHNHLQGVTMTDIEDVHKTLTQSYATQMPTDLKETLDAFTSMFDQSTLNHVETGTELIQSLGPSNQDAVHRSFAELKLQAHPVRDQLNTLMGAEATGPSGGFAPAFREVSQHYE